MFRLIVVALAGVLVSAAIAPADAACVSKKCPQEALVEQAREKAQETCGCTLPGQSHGQYIKCVKKLVKAADLAVLLPLKACRKLVTRCERHSICGKPNAVVCCKTKKNGTVKAAIKPFAAKCTNGNACDASGGLYSTADACAADGTCATTTKTTTSTTSTTIPGCEAACPNNPTLADSPKQLCLRVPLVDPTTGSNGSDLDTGFSGLSHNFPVPAAATIKYCLSNCDGVGDTTCDATGDTGGGSLNGPTFGAPLPLLSAGLPVCVVNRYQPGPITGTFDLGTGAGGDPNPNPVNLFSDIYLQSGKPEVCPRCVVPGVTDATAIGQSGTCSGTSTSPQAACVVDGFVKVVGVTQGDPNYTLSTSCVPSGRPVGILNIPLRLTTGTAQSLPGPNPCAAPPINQTTPDSCGGGGCGGACTNCLPTSPAGQCIDPKGGIAQVCCNTDSTKSCFPTRNGGTIQRQGKPGTASAVFASTFCIASTMSGSIDGVAGLPGPGSLLLPADITVLRHTP